MEFSIRFWLAPSWCLIFIVVVCPRLLRVYLRCYYLHRRPPGCLITPNWSPCFTPHLTLSHFIASCRWISPLLPFNSPHLTPPSLSHTCPPTTFSHSPPSSRYKYTPNTATLSSCSTTSPRSPSTCTPSTTPPWTDPRLISYPSLSRTCCSLSSSRSGTGCSTIDGWRIVTCTAKMTGGRTTRFMSTLRMSQTPNEPTSRISASPMAAPPMQTVSECTERTL